MEEEGEAFVGKNGFVPTEGWVSRFSGCGEEVELMEACRRSRHGAKGESFCPSQVSLVLTSPADYLSTVSTSYSPSSAPKSSNSPQQTKKPPPPSSPPPPSPVSSLPPLLSAHAGSSSRLKASLGSPRSSTGACTSGHSNCCGTCRCSCLRLLRRGGPRVRWIWSVGRRALCCRERGAWEVGRRRPEVSGMELNAVGIQGREMMGRKCSPGDGPGE